MCAKLQIDQYFFSHKVKSVKKMNKMWFEPFFTSHVKIFGKFPDQCIFLQILFQVHSQDFVETTFGLQFDWKS